LATGPNCGLIECIKDALSVDSLKKKLGGSNVRLKDFFLASFGKPKKKKYKRA
jgi:hypothetical protein